MGGCTCGATTPTGKSVGEECTQNPDGGTNECKGWCIGIARGSNPGPFTYDTTDGGTYQ